jgi:signal transduction histidine kinase
MSESDIELEASCSRAFAAYLAGGGEGSLHDAYELGRRALGAGVGLVPMSALVHGVLRRALAAARTPEEARRLFEAGACFLLECLSPFELAHRGAREANAVLRRLNEVREEELRRAARDLHDAAGQLLASAHLALEDAARELGGDARGPLQKVDALLEEAGGELRRLSHELRPPVLDDLGLGPALRFLAEGVARRSGLAIEFEGSTPCRLPALVETALYRIVQESLANIVKHAGASRVWLRLEARDGQLRCSVRDDGRGFDVESVMAPGAGRGLGLDTIRERAAEVGGSLQITSHPGQGTELVVPLPLEDARALAHSARG